MSLSLASILAESARRYPDEDAVVIGPQRISYTDLWEQTRRYAAVLAAEGVGPGNRVALLMPNVPDFRVSTTRCCPWALSSYPCMPCWSHGRSASC